jgi:uncharacterized protein
VQWHNEPSSWARTGSTLTVTADPGTDFWRTTGYGYVRDNGHLYAEPVPGDFELSVRLRGAYTAQYDQAGAMVRLDEHSWIKTGVEYFDGRKRFSTVVTMEYSSWALAELPGTAEQVSLLIRRSGDAVEVRYGVDGGAAELAAIGYLPPGRAVLAGVMCAAPEGPGFLATFEDLTITAG